MHYFKRKKPDLKNYILHDSFYMTFSKGQYYRDREQISDCQGLRRGDGLTTKGHHKEFLRLMELLYILSVVVIAQLYVFVKAQNRVL